MFSFGNIHYTHVAVFQNISQMIVRTKQGQMGTEKSFDQEGSQLVQFFDRSTM